MRLHKRIKPQILILLTHLGIISRKAYRLGKWLANVNKLRKLSPTNQQGFLELLANGGEAVYYFTEQLTWSALNYLFYCSWC